jgi:hypothetical protein
MNPMPIRLFAAALSLLAQTSFVLCQRAPAPNQELNTVLIHATFKIFGQKVGEPNKTTFGTVFIMGMPRKNDQSNSNIANIVLITAAHVLDEIGTDESGHVASYPLIPTKVAEP